MDRSEGFAFKFTRDRVGAVYIGVDDTEQANRLSLKLKLFVDAGMIASENAYAHHSDGNRILRWQEEFSMAGCRKEIVNANRMKVCSESVAKKSVIVVSATNADGRFGGGQDLTHDKCFNPGLI